MGSRPDAYNLDQTYTVDLSSVPRNGTWRLQVRDIYHVCSGRVDSWTLTL